MTNNDKQHTTALKRTLAKIGGCFSIIAGMYTMVKGVFNSSSDPGMDGINVFFGGVMIALGKSYLDSGRDATTLKKMLDQREERSTSEAPQQMAAPQHMPAPQAEASMLYRNDFATREAARAGSRAEPGAARGAA